MYQHPLGRTLDCMRTALWALFALAAAGAGGLALWARNTYASVEGVRAFFYSFQGYPVAAAELAAARDAQQAISTQVTMAWVLAGLALVLLLGAIVVTALHRWRDEHVDRAGDLPASA